MAAIADYRRDRAFERLYARYVRDVHRYVLAVLRNPAEAEDVTQTTFLNAYRAMLAGEEPQKPHNWLIAIAHNVCRSRLRFATRRPREVPLDPLVEQLEVPEAERPNLGELLRALGRLPVNQRAAITMRELEGRSHSEIAETLGVSVPAAEALIGRARRTLRAQATAIRGLAVMQLPQSLRNLVRPGEAAGGAAGSAAVAKVAAVVAAAGAVAGGAGLIGKGDAAGPAAPLPPRLELRVEVLRPAARRTRARTVRAARQAAAATIREAPRAHADGGRRPRFDVSSDAAVSTRAPAPRPERTDGSAGSAPLPSRPRGGVVRTARTASQTHLAQTVTTAETVIEQAAEPVQQAVSTVVAAATSAVPAVPAVPPSPAPSLPAKIP